MAGPVRITVAIRPSLALPKRWSVDYWQDDRVEAAYQVSLLTFDSAKAAAPAAAKIQSDFEAAGVQVTRVQSDANPSRVIRQPPCASEEELSKHLEAYVKDAFAPLTKITLASLFDLENLTKILKALATKSPHVLSLIILGALFFRGFFQRLLESIVPKELGLSFTELLAASPILLLVVTAYVYLARARVSSQMDRVRQWILQAVVSYGWDHTRFREFVRKELAKIEFANVCNYFDEANRRDPISFSNLIQTLGKTIEAKDGDYREFAGMLLRDDFARKIQALAGIGGEPDYRPKHLAVLPFHLLLSLSAIRSTILGITHAAVIKSIEMSRQYHEGMILIGFMIGAIVSLLLLAPALIWTTSLAWSISGWLFAIDVAAAVVTVLLLIIRPLAVAFRRKYVPRGLGLHECAGALNVM